MNDAEFEIFRATLIKHVISLIPDRLKSAFLNYLRAYPDISEIRFRVGAVVAFTLRGGNLMTGMKLERDDINYIVDRITEGNYFKNEEIMRKGYVSLPYGMRAGICGDVFVSSGIVKTLKTVGSINLRIPSTLIINCENLLSYIENSSFSASVLIISPPGGGKTTLLRSVCKALANAPYQKRVSVVDTNNELVLPFISEIGSIDYLSGYPKAYGIDVAIRYMNPEYIICDELGGKAEADTILEYMHSGVPLIASAHCSTFSELKLKKNIVNLLDNGVFDAVLRIKRVGKNFDYEIKKVCDL